MRKICNVLRLINAKKTFARTYKGTKDRAYKEILDEIVLLLGQVKCFHLSETESMKEHFISFSDFPYFFKQKSTAMHYLTLFHELWFTIETFHSSLYALTTERSKAFV